MKKTYFPQQFLDKYFALLGEEWEKFFYTIKRKQPKSFWVNTAKASIGETCDSLKAKGIKFENLKFHPNAFSIDLTEPGKLDEYTNSWISVQEKASMMPVVVLGVTKEDYVLDACAAPGMKTIQLSNLAGRVLATDVHSKRMEILNKTIKKFGLKNVEAKRIDFRNLKRNKRFDKILLDAPCSSEGLVRKKREALIDWSQNLVKRKSIEQKQFIVHAFDYLKEGGEMVYSTCTFAPEENEEVVQYLLRERNGSAGKEKFGRAVVVPVVLEGIKIRENKLCASCVRLYPQDNDTQQFFFAKIRKE
ncbi:MAG: RsmB/NOP family class I SAM-dependent RNA methyltransferase [Candidatus Diapherotrites archaeon]|nr:RsmB/NOP family class I SAM-dependent RNA methyltransferase [Candidatus Diapherotrites archaeon]